MARPREFDCGVVLDKVINVFWKSGFQGTSFAELERATGLKKGSLFAAFGDKEKLFGQALDHYQQRRIDELRVLATETKSKRQALKVWLAEAAFPERTGRGCMSVNTLVECSMQHADWETRVAAHLRQVESILAELIRDGKAQSEFQAHTKPRAAARFLVCILSGFNAMAKNKKCGFASNREASAVIDLVLQAL